MVRTTFDVVVRLEGGLLARADRLCDRIYAGRRVDISQRDKVALEHAEEEDDVEAIAELVRVNVSVGAALDVDARELVVDEVGDGLLEQLKALRGGVVEEDVKGVPGLGGSLAQVVVRLGERLRGDPLEQLSAPLLHDQNADGDIGWKANRGAKVANEGDQEMDNLHRVSIVNARRRPADVATVRGVAELAIGKLKDDLQLRKLKVLFLNDLSEGELLSGELLDELTQNLAVVEVLGDVLDDDAVVAGEKKENSSKLRFCSK